LTDFQVKSGTSIDFTTTVTRNDLPVNLAGLVSAEFTAKNSALDADADAVLTGSLGGWVTVTDAPNGKIRVLIPPGATAGYTKSRRLQWVLKIKESTGVVSSPDGGVLFIDLDVRRALP
jgi:hypothetical protein